MIDLSRLQLLVEPLKKQAIEVDSKRGETSRQLFDRQLFRTQSKLLTPCVDEVYYEINMLQKEQQAGRLSPTRTQHICDKIIIQIQAIQRELATLNIRKNEPKRRAYYRQPISEMYQNLNQHKDWERRLKTMLLDKEQQFKDYQPQLDRQQIQKEILALEGRISRCQAALAKIEKEINHREKKGY